jgi:hypothetical protein
MNTLNLSLRRWFRPSNPAEQTTVRAEVCPPSLRQAPDSLWLRARFWLLAPAPQDAAPPTNRLPAVRDEFVECLADITLAHTGDLLHAIQHARSLRELWHLRADVYRLVAVQHSQSEAESRMARLNQHFPTRAPRSGFAPL